jgi:hypothetical protein
VNVRDEVHDGDQQHRHRAAEVEQQLGSGVGQDLGWLAQVGLDDRGFGVVLEHEPAVRHRDLIVVHVDHTRSGGGTLRDLMDVLLGGDARADVEELPDAGLAGQEPNGPAEEGPVGA